MGPVLVVPFDDLTDLVLECTLLLGDRDPPQEFFDRPVEAFDDGDTAMLADGTEARQDVHGLAPDLSEVIAIKLGSLIHDQVLGSDPLNEHDSRQPGSHFLGRGPALEDGESHGSPGIVIDHVKQPPAHGPTLPEGVGNPVQNSRHTVKGF